MKIELTSTLLPSVRPSSEKSTHLTTKRPHVVKPKTTEKDDKGYFSAEVITVNFTTQLFPKVRPTRNVFVEKSERDDEGGVKSSSVFSLPGILAGRCAVNSGLEKFI